MDMCDHIITESNYYELLQYEDNVLSYFYLFYFGLYVKFCVIPVKQIRGESLICFKSLSRKYQKLHTYVKFTGRLVVFQKTSEYNGILSILLRQSIFPA